MDKKMIAYLLTGILLCSFNQIQAQDIITLNSKEELKVYIVKETKNTFRFVNSTGSKEKIKIVPKSNVQSITYANGEIRYILSKREAIAKNDATLSNTTLYSKDSQREKKASNVNPQFRNTLAGEIFVREDLGGLGIQTEFFPIRNTFFAVNIGLGNVVEEETIYSILSLRYYPLSRWKSFRGPYIGVGTVFILDAEMNSAPHAELGIKLSLGKRFYIEPRLLVTNSAFGSLGLGFKINQK